MSELRMIETNGIRLRAAVAGSGPLVVMIHGFPESWYSWRHQLQPLADAGFTACAIDVRGYGGSEKPHAVEAYALKEMTADVAGVIAALAPGQGAVVIGHDWGAPIAWHTALLHPAAVRAVAGLSVPYFDRPPAPLDQMFKAMHTDRGRFFYMAYFQDEGVAEAEFESDVRGALRKMYFGASGNADGSWGAGKPAGEPMLTGLVDPDPFPDWLTAADLNYFVGEFEKSGFRGPINRYRNFGRDWAMTGEIKDRRIHQPSLFVAGDRDPVLRTFGVADAAALTALMQPLLPAFKGVRLIPGCGHWTQQEAPAETTRILLEWLRTL